MAQLSKGGLDKLFMALTGISLLQKAPQSYKTRRGLLHAALFWEGVGWFKMCLDVCAFKAVKRCWCIFLDAFFGALMRMGF